MANDCIFCKIVSGDIPSKKVYEDEHILAFYDVDPQAPVHIIFIPKEHIPSAEEITGENSSVVSHIYETIAKVVKQLGLNEGFRVVCNCKAQGGQTVPHLHFHLLAGRNLGWPPG